MGFDYWERVDGIDHRHLKICFMWSTLESVPQPSETTKKLRNIFTVSIEKHRSGPSPVNAMAWLI